MNEAGERQGAESGGKPSRSYRELAAAFVLADMSSFQARTAHGRTSAAARGGPGFKGARKP
jgi:hypothetical protein